MTRVKRITADTNSYAPTKPPSALARGRGGPCGRSCWQPMLAGQRKPASTRRHPAFMLSISELRRARPDLADRWYELVVFPASFDTNRGRLGSAGGDGPRCAGRAATDLMRDLAGGLAAVAELRARADLAARLTARPSGGMPSNIGRAGGSEWPLPQGGTQVAFGLPCSFDRERRNIETGQAWAARLPRTNGRRGGRASSRGSPWIAQLRRVRAQLPECGVHISPCTTPA